MQNHENHSFSAPSAPELTPSSAMSIEKQPSRFVLFNIDVQVGNGGIDVVQFDVFTPGVREEVQRIGMSASAAFMVGHALLASARELGVGVPAE